MDRIIDSHCHLNDADFLIDLEDVINRFIDVGIKYVMVPGWDLTSSINSITLSNTYKSIYSAVGIHPENIEGTNISIIDKIEDLIKNNKVKAIGEVGLDYHYTKENSECQKEFFIKQIDLSFKYHLPLIIHMRDCDQEMLDLLKNYKKNKGIDKYIGVMHSYSGSSEMMKGFIKLGFYISFSGPITFKNAPNQVKSCMECPLDRILVETDSPYMAPTPFRGKRNEPTYVKYVLEKMAEIKNISLEDAENIVYNNFCKLFMISEE